MLVAFFAVAGAQTTTTLSLNPAPVPPATGSVLANGSVLTMTAQVKAGTALGVGTVTFRDTYNSITQVLGTVQVQSANGTRGNAVLRQQLGGIGTHSIVATFNGINSNPTSFSGTQSVTVTGKYPTVASLVQSGGTTGNYSLTTTVVGVGSPNLLPTGNISLTDTNNSNLLLGIAGLGAGTFREQTVTAVGSPITVGTNPQDIVAGDFNGDGIIDLAVLNSTSQTISILLGDGLGGFKVFGTPRTTGNGPVAIAAGDFNGDGKLDIAVANSADQTVWIQLGNGDGTFNTHSSYPVSLLANSLTALALGDFNGDGIPDLAVLGGNAAGGAVNILQNNGSGVFSNVTGTGISVGNGPSALVTGDFNGDGNLDFAVANQTDNTISVMKGNGSGNVFTAFSLSPFSTGAGTNPAAIAVADFNGDGQPDLAVAESGINRVDIFKGNGDGTFSLLAGTQTTGSKPVAIVAGDFNVDGKADFAVTNQTDNTTTVMLGSGTGSVFTAAALSPFTTGTGTTSPVAIAAADFNGDGAADIAVANSNKNNIGILLNQLTDTASVQITGISVPGNGTSNHTVNASYAGDANFATSSQTLSLLTSTIPTTTLLGASSTTLSFGQQVVLTATVQPSLVGNLFPTQNVTFRDGAATLGSVAVSSGVATLNVTTLSTGTHSITATYAGDTNFITSTSAPLGIIVGKSAPVITWPTPSPITYWTLLSGTQLNATANVPGTFAYSQPLYAQLSAGAYTLTTTFTPTDLTNYTIATASVTLVVNPATPLIAWATPAPISLGTALSGIQLNAVAAVYNMVPLPYNVTGIYTDGSTFGVPPGGFDGTGAAYSSNLLGTTVTWNNITYTLGPTNAPDAVANTTVNLPAGHFATLNLLGALVNGNVSTASTFVVTYTDNSTTTVSQNLSDWVFPLNYAGETNVTCVSYRNNANGTKDAHLTCIFGYQIALDSTKIVKSITLPPTRNNVFLDMALVSPPVPGTLAYTPPAGTLLPTGANTLSVLFTPTDSTDYTTASGSVLQLVNPNTTALQWPTPAPITYGTALSSTQLDALAVSVPGTTSVSLSPYYRVNALQSDGSVFSTGGFDNSGNAFSSNQAGSSISWNGQTYSLGPANLPDAVTSTTIALPQGNFVGLALIGAATTTGQTAQQFTLNFTDGTSGTGLLDMSSWIQPAGYSDETIVSTTPYRNTGSGGRTTGNTYLYGYVLPTDVTKTVKSLTLPNNRNVVIVAVSLFASPNTVAIPGTYVYTPPAGAVPAAGTVPLSVLFTATNTAFGTATKTVNLVVNKASLAVTANNETVGFGTPVTPYTDTITGFVNGDASSVVTGTASLTTTPAIPSAAGAYTITAAQGTLAAANYSFNFVPGTLTIAKKTPTVTWANPANVLYGTSLSGTQLNATASVPGTFAYTPASGTKPTAGTDTLSVTFTPTDSTDYNPVTQTVQIVVTQATPVITWSNPAGITYGTALSSTQLNATSPIPGTFVYTPAAGTVPAAGTDTLSVTFTPTDTRTTPPSPKRCRSDRQSSYSGHHVDPIRRASPMEPRSRQRNSTRQPLCQEPSSILQRRESSQLQAPILSRSPLPRLTQRITPPSPRRYRLRSIKRRRLSPGSRRPRSPMARRSPATQLERDCFGSRHFGLYSRCGHHSRPAPILSRSPSLRPTPRTTRRLRKTVQLTVNQATPVITWSNPASIAYGTALSATQLNATASVPGALVYTPAAGSIPAAGTDTLTVTFTPTDSTDYTTATKTVQITVTQANPVITWSNPAAITYGTALSATQLNATASVPGTLVYTPAAGNVPIAGTDTLSVTFTPTDTTNYTTVTKTVQIVVNQATPVITWTNPASIIYGTALSATQLNATASVPGTLVYTPAAGNIPSAGTDTLSVTFTPTDTTDYTTVTQDRSDRRQQSGAGHHMVQSSKHHLRNIPLGDATECNCVCPWHVGLLAGRWNSSCRWYRHALGHLHPDRHHQLHHHHSDGSDCRHPGHSSNYLVQSSGHHLRHSAIGNSVERDCVCPWHVGLYASRWNNSCGRY